MNRVIKFRAWHLDDGMVYFDFDTFKKDYHDQYGNIMQFTGLTDRNGTEIYEGDILGDSYQSIGVVIWNSDSASFLINYTDDLQNIEEGDLSWAEVIGNIHQNPELLNP